jgi:hypothetical protein
MISLKCPRCPIVHHDRVWGEKVHCSCGAVLFIGYPESVKQIGQDEPEPKCKEELCQRCKSDRVAAVSARCKDQCWTMFRGKECEGYVPSWLGEDGGEDLIFSLCLNCGQVQGEFPRWTHWERGEDG